MPPQVVLTIFFSIALPIAWVASEFQPRRWIRITLGMLSLAMSIFIALTVGLMQQLNYNSWYGEVSANLVDTIIVEIEAGRTERLAESLRHLRSEFHPTYRNRANYDKLTNEFTQQIVLKRFGQE